MSDEKDPGAGELLGDAQLLAPGLVHEMRQPLVGIKSGLQFLERRVGGQLLGLEEGALVKAQVTRLEEILKSYHDLLSPERTTPAVFAVAPVVRRALDLLAFRTRALGTRLSIEVDETLLAFGTSNALLHAVTNLVTNALDALDGKDGRLAIRVRQGGQGRVEVRVSDQGSGIPADLASRIFEARFTTKAKGKGTGLGLYIARRMLLASGGAVRLVLAGEPGRLDWAMTELCIELPGHG
jgi:signal transduction histidine kinase